MLNSNKCEPRFAAILPLGASSGSDMMTGLEQVLARGLEASDENGASLDIGCGTR